MIQTAALKISIKETSKTAQLPIKGQPLYIGDRQRDANLRNEIMQQMNEHTRLLGQVHNKLMAHEKDQIQ